MSLPGGHWEMRAYRYGFNGKEDDKDFGEGVQDYGARVYSRLLGTFQPGKSLDTGLRSTFNFVFYVQTPQKLEPL
jgi:hypothetical protein